MTKNKSRIPSLTSSLRILRSSLGGKHGNSRERNPEHSRVKDSGRETRIVVIDSTNIYRQNRSAPDLAAIDALEAQAQRTGKNPRRGISAPLKTHYNHVADSEQIDCHEKAGSSISQEKSAMQFRHLVARVRRQSFLPHSQPTTGLSHQPFYSRLPTPTEPPKGKLYSHSVYQKEGRRSALSSWGRRRTSILGSADRSHPNDGKYSWLPHTNRVQPKNNGHNPFPRGLTPARLSKEQREPNIPVPRRDRVDGQHQAVPITALRRSSTQPSMTDHRPPDGVKERFIGEGLSVRKARTGVRSQIQGSLPHYNQTKSINLPSFSRPLNEKAGEKVKMPSPRRVRVTKGQENLRRTNTNIQLTRTATVRAAAPHKINTPVRKKQSIQNSVQQEDVSTPAKNAEKSSQVESPVASVRRSGQTWGMVPIPTDCSSGVVPCPRRPVLTTNVTSCSQVEEAQPEQYWLGRFVTLNNAFHYEDSFGQPDISTGFGMLSSYSRPLQHSGDDLLHYRIKRAFMTLENLCATEEASESLWMFRDNFIKRFGDCWMT